MVTTCPTGCGTHQPDGLLCHTCTTHLEHTLRGIPELVRELDITLSRQARLGTPAKGGLAREKTPIHFGAAAAAWELEKALTGWAATVSGNVVATTTHAAHILLLHMDAIRRDAEVKAPIDKVDKAVDQSRQAIDAAANRTIIPVGPCPETDTNGQDCPGEVFAFIPTEDERPSRMQCKTTPEHKWSSVQWLRTGRRILDTINKREDQASAAIADGQLITAQDAARRHATTVAYIYKLASLHKWRRIRYSGVTYYNLLQIEEHFAPDMTASRLDS